MESIEQRMSHRERILDISKAMVPIGAVLAAFVTVATAIWFMSSVSTKQEVDHTRIDRLEQKIEELPTQNDYKLLKEDVGSIKSNVQKILDKLNNL